MWLCTDKNNLQQLFDDTNVFFFKQKPASINSRPVYPVVGFYNSKKEKECLICARFVPLKTFGPVVAGNNIQNE